MMAGAGADGFLSPGLGERLRRLLGRHTVAARAVQGGYTSACRLIVTFDDHSSAFVKVANDDLTAAWLRDEWRIYSAVTGPFMPRVLGWDDGGDGDYPLLVIEDLSAGVWPSTWTKEHVDSVLVALEKVRCAVAPPGLRTLESYREDFVGWEVVAQDPAPFLGLDLCDAAWLEAALPALIAADKRVVLAGSEFLHLDIRSDNICFHKDNCYFVDWNWACVGNARMDVIFWLPSLASEGGEVPYEIIDAEPELVCLAAGFWAKRAGLPPPSPGSKVRDLQCKQLKIVLPWVSRVLGLAD